ncbi:MAG: potassium-transporting ATPase subunit F [Bacteroidota bacterium]|nr:potassium-transporting ATPase subunit F [Bacteroidota bacterium]
MIILLLAVAVVLYLLYALIYPEQF